ncbi:MAG TPA: phytanoyl-CoA dioxygenase family protein [Capsulimonadaceae bacterium]|nr:phytanoyl-CoA dioxygenase family protein [Capsulimonadaceae bacterium]
MGIAYNESAIPGRHKVLYRTRDAHRGFPLREVDVFATPDEIDSFVENGYLVRESLIPNHEIERLRQAMDETVAKDKHVETQGGRSFGGIFIRHMMDKHQAFLDFLHFQPTLSVARALFGPVVQMRGFTGRVCYPDHPNQETEWHFHQRVIPDPLPPLFATPETLDILLYLDEIDDNNGPLCLIPGSHKWLERDLGTNDFADKPGQITLHLPAGSCVMAHGSLWHRAMPTRPGGTLRRLLLFGYSPAWQKASIYGEKPKNGLTEKLLADPATDEETRELLGIAGYM